jgi:transposase
MLNENIISQKFKMLNSSFNEQNRRLWAAVEATIIGHGGITVVSRASGLSRTTIHQGLKELENNEKSPPTDKKRIRLKGGGRKPIFETDQTLLEDLERLVDPFTRGDPQSPLRWTCKSVRKLAEALQEKGHKIGRQKVADLLSKLGYSLQANSKKREGNQHEDRDKQFNYISERVIAFQLAGQPVISVDTKKKELIGDFKNGGQEWQPKGKPEIVRDHDFPDKELGKVNPYGIYVVLCHP